MRKFFACVFGLSIVLSSSVPAYSCGDKLLVLGRGIRFQTLTGTRPANILAYLHAGTDVSALAEDQQFQLALKKAGYQLRVVRDDEEVDVALRSGKYDLVIAEVADLNAIDSTLHSMSRTPALLPILYEPTKLQITSVEQRYRYVLKAPNKDSHYLSVIEKALEMKFEAEAKLKRDHRKAGGAP
jgi:hypothetical protein